MKKRDLFSHVTEETHPYDMLNAPQINRPYALGTDTCHHKIVCMLLRKQDSNIDRMIEFLLRVLNDRKQNPDVTH